MTSIPEFETLAVSIEQQVATVVLNRPDKANSMNAAMWPELQLCFEWLDAEPGVRAGARRQRQALLRRFGPRHVQRSQGPVQRSGPAG